ncbi:MAG TPA: hypothetical protein VFS02_07575 [Telluria sp.]|nr:hypothetical protein [Telluria sp.]
MIIWPKKSRPDGNKASQMPLHAKQKYTNAIKISMAFPRLFLIGIRSLYLRSNTVRPPDENQPGSTRPNFTSSARRSSAGDDNILARLERDARRGRVGKQGWKHARLAWCLLASVAVIGLVGTLASLTRENLTTSRPPTLIEARSTPPDLSASSAAALVKSGFAPLPAPDLKLAAADLPPEPVKPPPMVMLKPAPEAAVRPAAAPKPAVKRAPAKPAVKAPPVKVAAAKPAPARPIFAASPPPRPKRPAAAPAIAAESAAVDSDVALLSAIIMHSSRHAAERAQLEAARCGAGKKCPPPADPLSPLKATD